MTESRDGWSKLDIVLKAIVGVGMPAVLFLVGHQFTLQQQAAADANRQLERVTSLIQPLASDKPRERKLAIVVVGYLAKTNQLPPEFVPVLQHIIKDDPSAVEAQAASVALEQVEETNPHLRPEIEADFKAAPARIYFHINSDSQRKPARKLGSQLIEALGPGFVVPGVEKRRGPSRSELRFFKQSEKEEAERIATFLLQLDPQGPPPS